MLGEPHAFRRKAIKSGRADLLLPKRADVPVSEVVRENEDDVRLPRGAELQYAGTKQERGEKTAQVHGHAK